MESIRHKVKMFVEKELKDREIPKRKWRKGFTISMRSARRQR